MDASLAGQPREVLASIGAKLYVEGWPARVVARRLGVGRSSIWTLLELAEGRERLERRRRTQLKRFRWECEAFLERTLMAETTFGRLAAGQPDLVRFLREGRSVRPETRVRVRAFIDGWTGG